MKINLIAKIMGFFKRPDWILRTEVFIVITTLPVIYVFAMAFYTTSKFNQLSDLESEVVYLEKLIQTRESAINKHEGAVQTSYIQKFLEPIKFLSADRKQLALLCSQMEDKDLFPGIKSRLSFLQSEENRLNFTSKESKKEIFWEAEKPVEMSCLDLKRIVTLVEGRAIEPFYTNPYRPDMYFSKLTIKKINQGSAGVYSVDMQILQKRES